MCQECGRWQQMAERDGARLTALEEKVARMDRALAEDEVALNERLRKMAPRQ